MQEDKDEEDKEESKDKEDSVRWRRRSGINKVNRLKEHFMSYTTSIKKIIN